MENIFIGWNWINCNCGLQWGEIWKQEFNCKGEQNNTENMWMSSSLTEVTVDNPNTWQTGNKLVIRGIRGASWLLIVLH